MANKSLSTRQKMSFRIAPSKPRNPVALQARMRAAGVHGKTNSAERAELKKELKKDLAEVASEDGKPGDRQE